MITPTHIAKTRGWVVLPAVLILVACQSLSTDHSPTVSFAGEKASERYAYMNRAISDFSSALKADEANFDNIEFSHELLSKQDVAVQTEQQTQKKRVHYLAENFLARHGQYEFLFADTHNNRIEFRSSDAFHHLSITIHPTVVGQSEAISPYVVADMFGQVSLKELSEALPQETVGIQQNTMTPIDVSLMRLVTQSELETDSSILTYLNNLPETERGREDILRLRSSLYLKTNQSAEASSLIESGIVRYPHNPSFFVMAEYLVTQSDLSTSDMSDSLKSIMGERFSLVSIDSRRQALKEFLSASMYSPN